MFSIFYFVPSAKGGRLNRNVLVGAALSAVTQFAALGAMADGHLKRKQLRFDKLLVEFGREMHLGWDIS